MLHTVPHLRLLALLALGVVFIFYRPGAEPELVNSILLPLLAFAAAWYLSGSLVAVAFGVLLLGIAHSDLASAAWHESVAYPALALIAGATLAVSLTLRFRKAMHARREARRREQNHRQRDE